MVPVLVGVAFVTFTMMYFSPGNPEDFILGDMATDEDRAIFRAEKGLDDPFAVQFVRYLTNVVRGDFGISFTTRMPVLDEVLVRFNTTFMLSVYAIIIATVFGVSLGIISAVKQNSILDNLVRIFAMLGVSMPTFWLGLMLIILFSVVLGILPSSGLMTWRHWILPAVTLCTQSLASIMRMVRSAMLESIRQDYVVTAKAKGQKPFVIIMKHVFRNAMLPIITVIGVNFARLLGGAAVIEIVFAVPGAGALIIDAIRLQNAPVVQGGILFVAIWMSFINLFVDVIYAFVDPRLRSQYITVRKQMLKGTLKNA